MTTRKVGNVKLGFVPFTRTHIRGIEQRLKQIQRQLDEERAKGLKASTAAVFCLEEDKAFWILKLKQGGDYTR